MKGVFVTGTDTDVGKTVVSALLLSTLNRQLKTRYFKPIQSGEHKDYEEVCRLTGLDTNAIVPVTFDFPQPISPNRAATLNGVDISVQKILDTALEQKDHFLIVEGAGGIEVPISRTERISDVANQLNLPVVVVSSTRLGTINHTILTCEKIQSLGLPLAGIVLVGEPDPGLTEVLGEQGIDVLCELPRVDSLEGDWQSLEDKISASKLSERLLTSDKENEDTHLSDEGVWHPFTQHKIVKDFPRVDRGIGAELLLQNGQRIIDAVSSWWVNIHGHSHPAVAAAIAKQANTLEHVIFAGFTHQPAQQLTQKILDLTNQSGASMGKVFFSDNGSTAVEVAFKMAYQVQQRLGRQNKKRFLALKGGYHGDTLGAMALGGDGGFHDVFKPLMMPVDFIDPFDIESINNLDGSSYAACVLEPMVQGAGGMRMYSAEFLKALSAFCKQNHIVLICDEIFTGFYRTGTRFAFEHAEINPDIVCLSKGLTGGFLPLALTVTTNAIFESFLSDSLSEAFLHGHSYTANPIACSAALASLELLEAPECQEQIKSISAWTEELLGQVGRSIKVNNTRSLGTIGAFDVQGREGYFQGDFSASLTRECLKRGALIRPLGGTLYTVPPYCIRQDQLEKVYDVLLQVLKEQV